MDKPPASTERTERPPTSNDALLRGTGLCLAYNGRQILDHVDIGVDRGEVVTVVGLNGCGKSTLVRALLGLTRVDSGAVWHRPGLRIGYTPQRMKIDPVMPMTVARFLRLGGRYDDGRLAAALDEVELNGTLNAQMSKLSGGEFNRVALARALLRDPDILVLDEPLSSVDYVGQVRLYELIESIRRRRGCGVLMVSHDLHLVISTTNTVVCLNHHVCCSGRPREVIGNPEFVALFGRRLAESLALYVHRHDHSHDPSGRIVSEAGDRDVRRSAPGDGGA